MNFFIFTIEALKKRKIFLSKKDHGRFISLLYLCNSKSPVKADLRGSTSEIFGTIREETLVDVCAYCLMPNHFHLILKEKTDGGISKFMQKLITGYTMYFNKSNERSGSLFQGRFKAVHCDSDKYLSYMIAYLHLNPIKLIDTKWKEDGIKNRVAAEKFLDKYKYSSFNDYGGKYRVEKSIISFDAMPKYHKNHLDFKKSITEWLIYSEVQPRSNSRN